MDICIENVCMYNIYIYNIYKFNTWTCLSWGVRKEHGKQKNDGRFPKRSCSIGGHLICGWLVYSFDAPTEMAGGEEQTQVMIN